MRHRWWVLGSVVLLALAAGVLVSQGIGQAQAPQSDLIVAKSVDPAVTAPDRVVLYIVTLDNASGSELVLSSLTDTLPDGFEYVGLAPGSEWTVEPVDNMAPLIQWAGPIPVPAGESLTLRYDVYVPSSVPLSPEPYINTVVATVGADQYTAQTGLLVAEGEVSLTKDALPNRVEPGETVTYTLAFSNSGYVPVPLAVVTDVLPIGVTFVRMTGGSDVQAPPDGVMGTISWDGPFTIASHDEFLVEYQAAMPLVSDTLHLENTAWGQLGDGTVVGPASAEVVLSTGGPSTVLLPLVVRNWAPAAFVVAKTADPSVVYAQAPGALITYTVVFSNEGTVPGVLAEIRDTLPAGFTFQRMLPGSDVVSDPAGRTGEIVWTGPFTVAGQGVQTVIYEVRASTQAGTYINSATAIASVGKSPPVPASATVEAKPAILLQDAFDSNADQWTPFLNLQRLGPCQWWWQDWGGYEGGGAYLHSNGGCPGKEAHDALSMALVPGSENWTDYRYEARVYLDPSSYWTTQVSLWFRGNYQESEVPGQWVLGYYFLIYPKGNKVLFMQTQTPDDCVGEDCFVPEVLYHFSNPLPLLEVPYPLGEQWFGSWHLLAVEVQGSHMKGYIDGNLAIEFTDTVGTIISSGTVGLGTYKVPGVRFDNVLVTPLD